MQPCHATACLLCTRHSLGALEAVIEDGQSLQVDHTQAHALLLARLRLVYSQAATSLALMSDTVAAYGRPERSNPGCDAFVTASRSSSRVTPEPPAGAAAPEAGAAGAAAAGASAKRAAPAPVGGFCGLVSVFGRSWAEAKADLATYMQEEVVQHWSRVVSAAPNSPTILPSLAFVSAWQPLAAAAAAGRAFACVLLHLVACWQLLHCACPSSTVGAVPRGLHVAAPVLPLRASISPANARPPLPSRSRATSSSHGVSPTV